VHARCIALHPSGEYLVLPNAGDSLGVRNASTFERLKEFTKAESPDLAGMFKMMAEVQQLNRTMSPDQLKKLVFGKAKSFQLFQHLNPESFSILKFSDDGRWLATGSDRGLKVWSWAKIIEAPLNAAVAPAWECEARPGPWGGGRPRCYAVAFDRVRQQVLFGGMEGIVESLDLQTGRVRMLLDPPERLAITALALSPDQRALAVQGSAIERNSPRPSELRLWNYEALCTAQPTEAKKQ